MNEERSTLMEQHRTDMETKDAMLEEQRIAASIKEKKKAKMIKELQEQVKREMIKSQEQKCQTLRLEDEISDLKLKNEALLQSANRLSVESQKRSSSASNLSTEKNLDLRGLHHDSPNGKSSPFVVKLICFHGQSVEMHFR